MIVPDLRGYGRSDKPGAVDAYSIPLLAGDVLAVLADLGVGRAHVVGHDWGAALAWALASLAPGSVDHVAVLSVGNPVTFLRKYSNYLAPRTGLFSTDTWVIGSIWLRNVLLNQLILLPTIGGAILALLITGLGYQARRDHLKDMLGTDEVFEPVLAKIPQLQIPREIVAHQLLGRP